MNFARVAEINRSKADIQWINPPFNVVSIIMFLFIEVILLMMMVCGAHIGTLRPFDIDYNPPSKIDPDKEYGGRNRQYCRYCRRGMLENGNIKKYMGLITNYRLEKHEVKMVKRLLEDRWICPKCYRPYKQFPDGTTDRLSRFEIQFEVVCHCTVHCVILWS